MRTKVAVRTPHSYSHACTQQMAYLAVKHILQASGCRSHDTRTRLQRSMALCRSAFACASVGRAASRKPHVSFLQPHSFFFLSCWFFPPRASSGVSLLFSALFPSFTRSFLGSVSRAVASSMMLLRAARFAAQRATSTTAAAARRRVLPEGPALAAFLQQTETPAVSPSAASPLPSSSLPSVGTRTGGANAESDRQEKKKRRTSPVSVPYGVVDSSTLAGRRVLLETYGCQVRTEATT